MHFGLVDQAEPRAGCMADIDILGHGKLIEQNGLLVDGRDAGFGGVVRGRQRHGFAIDADRTAVWADRSLLGF